MARFRAPSAAVLAARSRRGARTGRETVRIDWFVNRVANRVDLTMRQRVSIAVKFLESRVVKNISKAVTKGTGPRGGRVVTGRSRRGEFPHAETTQLLKSIFTDVRARRGVVEGFVGTPLDYGLILETQMDRSFLVKTLDEEIARIRRIITGPIR